MDRSSPWVVTARIVGMLVILAVVSVLLVFSVLGAWALWVLETFPSPGCCELNEPALRGPRSKSVQIS